MSDALLPPAAEPAPARPSGLTRLAALAEVILLSGLPTQLVIGAALAAAGVSAWAADGSLSLRFVAAGMALDTAAIATLAWLALRARGESMRRVLLGARPAGPEIRRGLVLLPLLFAGSAGLLWLLRTLVPVLHTVATNPFEALIRSTGDAVLLGAAAVVGGGIKEEVQRAFILHRFDQYLGGARLGLSLYSLAFGAGHALQGLDVGVATALLGLVWGIVYVRRRSVLAPMVSHSGFNAAQIIQFAIFGS